MPLRVALICFRRVDITQRDAARVVLLLCHVRKTGLAEEFSYAASARSKLLYSVLLITIAFAFEHSSACGGSLDCNKS